MLLGIDPDAGGAIAVVQWAVDTPRTPEGFPVSLLDSSISVHDMPMETIAVSKRNRRCADENECAVMLTGAADNAPHHLNLLLPSRLVKFRAQHAHGDDRRWQAKPQVRLALVCTQHFSRICQSCAGRHHRAELPS